MVVVVVVVLVVVGSGGSGGGGAAAVAGGADGAADCVQTCRGNDSSLSRVVHANETFTDETRPPRRDLGVCLGEFSYFLENYANYQARCRDNECFTSCTLFRRPKKSRLERYFVSTRM